MNAGTMRLPLPKIKSSTGGVGVGGSISSAAEGSNGNNSNSKENTLNSTHSTPTKQPSNNNSNEEGEEEEPTILSPTPYWKVLEERGTKKTSPRTTRSATKKKKAAQEESGSAARGGGGLFARGMQELDELAEEEEGDGNVGNDDNVNLNPMSELFRNQCLLFFNHTVLKDIHLHLLFIVPMYLIFFIL